MPSSRRSVLIPKLVTSLQTYDRQQFVRDLGAGVIVGIVALPLAIAFAIASGVTPDRGLWTAIVAGFIISALGGSRVQIGGPTGAFVVIVAGVVQKFGVNGLLVATLMAGVLLVAFGFAKLGGVIKFIPQPVITGFTSGIAVIIFMSQIEVAVASAAAVGVVLVTLAIIIAWPKVTMRVPAPFVALIATTIAVHALHLPVETVGSRFGSISASFPVPTLPHVTFPMMAALVGPAFTIALLAAIESLLSAVVSDGMIGGRHRSNMELVAQGIANIASPIMGGMPATGAIARTATNVKNGGRTPVAGMVHALTLLVITLAAGRWAALVPMPTLAGILIVVAYHMSEWRAFRAELTSPKSDVLVLLTTFALTVLVDLTVAIEVGMVLAAFLFIRRMAEVTNIQAVTSELEDDPTEQAYSDPNSVRSRRIPPSVEVYEINGPFFFGAAELFKDTLARVARKPKVLIIRMRNVLALDSSGLHALKDVVHRTRKDGTVVVLSDVHMQPLVALTGSAVLAEIGQDNIFGNLDDALNKARQILGLPTDTPPPNIEPTVERER